MGDFFTGLASRALGIENDVSNRVPFNYESMDSGNAVESDIFEERISAEIEIFPPRPARSRAGGEAEPAHDIAPPKFASSADRDEQSPGPPPARIDGNYESESKVADRMPPAPELPVTDRADLDRKKQEYDRLAWQAEPLPAEDQVRIGGEQQPALPLEKEKRTAGRYENPINAGTDRKRPGLDQDSARVRSEDELSGQAEVEMELSAAHQRSAQRETIDRPASQSLRIAAADYFANRRESTEKKPTSALEGSDENDSEKAQQTVSQKFSEGDAAVPDLPEPYPAASVEKKSAASAVFSPESAPDTGGATPRRLHSARNAAEEANPRSESRMQGTKKDPSGAVRKSPAVRPYPVVSSAPSDPSYGKKREYAPPGNQRTGVSKSESNEDTVVHVHIDRIEVPSPHVEAEQVFRTASPRLALGSYLAGRRENAR